jgi:segregation and condensation protein A
MSYFVKLEKFEGPMELLLELIEKEKMKISELSLASIADQYLEYIQRSSNIKLENLSEFLSVASRLILIKSRSLIPALSLTAEEEAEIEDLTKQLEEYKKFKTASEKIGRISRRRKISYSREGFFGIKTIFYPPENFNIFDLKKYFQKVLLEIPIIEVLQEEIVAEVITLEQRINELEETLRNRIETSFSDLIAGTNNKADIIVSFLAVLEMIKQRIVKVEQNELFEEIKLSMNKS